MSLPLLSGDFLGKKLVFPRQIDHPILVLEVKLPYDFKKSEQVLQGIYSKVVNVNVETVRRKLFKEN